MDARGPKYTVNGIGFTSKKAVQDHCRGIIKKATNGLPPQYGCRLPILDNDDERFLLDFIRFLPSYEQYGKDVSQIVVGYVASEAWSPHWGLYALLPDASEWCFGFNKFNLTPAQSGVFNLTAAKRNAILDQTYSYKMEYFDGQEQAPCEATGETMVLCSGFPNSCHVDHEHPTFAKLDEAFFGGWEPDLFDDGVLWQICEKFDDVKQSWQEFHRKHAKLRCVTRTFNLTRGKQ